MPRAADGVANEEQGISSRPASVVRYVFSDLTRSPDALRVPGFSAQQKHSQPQRRAACNRRTRSRRAGALGLEKLDCLAKSRDVRFPKCRGLRGVRGHTRAPAHGSQPCPTRRVGESLSDEESWRPQRDSNPCRGLERAVS
jgi:hypothetical protein